MNLPNLEIKFTNIINQIERHKEEARIPKFQIGQELDIVCDLMTKGDKIIYNYGTTRIKIKNSKYSKSLKYNCYTIIMLDTVGQIEKFITEKELEDLRYKEVNKI